MSCHCQSKLDFSKCCEPFHKGELAPTAESCMRSRFSAFVECNIDYIRDTHSPNTKDGFDYDGTKQWAEESEFTKLEIVSAQQGGEKDSTGIVEFKAHYNQNGQKVVHHERSTFEKIEGKWFFSDGSIVSGGTVMRDAPKVGRNDPCPCGSGKKHKKCCLNN